MIKKYTTSCDPVYEMWGSRKASNDVLASPPEEIEMVLKFVLLWLHNDLHHRSFFSFFSVFTNADSILRHLYKCA